jgi:glyoxylase I family protein
MALTVGGLTPMLEVYDLPRSLAFYRDVLGAELTMGDDSWWCMLRIGEAQIMLNTAYEDDERPPMPEPRRVRAHADTSLYFSTLDPYAVYANFRQKQWPATEPSLTSYGMLEVTAQDPDGFQLVFLRPAGNSQN